MAGESVETREKVQKPENIAGKNVVEIRKQTTQATEFLVAGLLAGIIGGYGLGLMAECEYFLESVSPGYTIDQFVGLVVGCVLFPLSLVCFGLFAVHSYRSNSMPFAVKVACYVGLCIVAVGGAYLCHSINGVGPTVDCAVVFCIIPSVWADPMEKAGPNFIAIGMYASCIGVFLAFFLLLVLVCIHPKSHTPKSGLMSSEEGRPTSGSYSGRRREGVRTEVPMVVRNILDDQYNARARNKVLVGVLFVWFFFLFFCCMVLPDMWKDLTVSELQSWAAEDTSESDGTVWKWKWSDSLILKLFPDILMFYGFLFVVALVALVAQAVPRLQEALFQTFKWSGGICLGELLLTGLFAIVLVCDFYYWFTDHNWEGNSNSSYTIPDRVGRTISQLANFTAGLLVLPASRNNMWSLVFGVSWEAMIRIHRWLGYLFLALGIAHVICMEMAIAEQGYAMPQNIFKIPLDYHADNFTIPLMFLAFVALLITQGILSLEIVRRRMYEVFYYAHHMALVFFVVMLWHANMAWYYVIGGLALWVVDRGVRMFRNLSNVNVLDAECLDGGIVKLSYLAESGGAGPLKGEETPMQHRAGQFIYLNVPAISTLQWHPFTISSAPSDNATTNHIKNMGPGTFTDSLYQMVHTLSQAGLAHQLAINVDGPYGLPVEFGKYTHILFVAGGIGVTPLHSCFRELYVNVLEGTGRLSGLASVKLVWAARDMGVFTAFKDTLSAVKANPGYRIFSYDLFLTENKDVLKAAPEKSPHGSQLTTTAGRPDINGMISDLQEFGKKALVFACGPAKMQKECQQLSMTYGVDYHGETFEL